MKNINLKDKEKTYLKILTVILVINIISMIPLIILNISLSKSVGVGRSMEPSIPNGCQTLNSSLYLSINKGDIICANPRNDGENYIVAKRVVATEGDHVYMHNGHLYINDIEDTTDSNAIYDAEIDLVIPKNCYYILGDNRNHSKDSRAYGYITKGEIVSKVIKIYK